MKDLNLNQRRRHPQYPQRELFQQAKTTMTQYRPSMMIQQHIRGAPDQIQSHRELNPIKKER